VSALTAQGHTCFCWPDAGRIAPPWRPAHAATLIAGVAELVTNESVLGAGPLRLVPDAALVVQDSAVAWVRLDLGFRVHAENNSLLRRVQARTTVSRGRSASCMIRRMRSGASSVR
jgi:hypothetical protein